MKKSFLVFLVAMVLAVAAPPNNFDARVEALRYSLRVSGLAIADFSQGYQDLSFKPVKGSK